MLARRWTVIAIPLNDIIFLCFGVLKMRLLSTSLGELK